MTGASHPTVALRDIAYVRFGDKGDLSNMVVVARAPEHWETLVRELTEARVAAEFRQMARGPVVRHLVPELHSINFLLGAALGGGVTRSLALDRHGKSRSGYAGGIRIALS